MAALDFCRVNAAKTKGRFVMSVRIKSETGNAIEASYNPLIGIIIRRDGRSRPGSFDEVADVYGVAALDRVMDAAGRYVTLTPPASMTLAEARAIVAFADARYGDAEPRGTPAQYDRLIADVRSMRINSLCVELGSDERGAA